MWGTLSCLLGDRGLEGIQVEEENACVGPGEQASFIRGCLLPRYGLFLMTAVSGQDS